MRLLSAGGCIVSGADRSVSIGGLYTRGGGGKRSLYSERIRQTQPSPMNSAARIVTIIFRFVAISLVLILAYDWIAYLLTPTLELSSSADTNHVHQLRLEGMFRHTVVVLL